MISCFLFFQLSSALSLYLCIFVIWQLWFFCYFDTLYINSSNSCFFMEAKFFTRYSLLFTRYSFPFTCYSLFLLFTRNFLLITHCFLLVTRYFLLVTHCYLLFLCCYLLGTHDVLFVKHCIMFIMFTWNYTSVLEIENKCSNEGFSSVGRYCLPWYKCNCI